MAHWANVQCLGPWPKSGVAVLGVGVAMAFEKKIRVICRIGIMICICSTTDKWHADIDLDLLHDL